jgi:hypothetical protein
MSVRCLSEDQIRRFLSSLANNGFVAWYRKPDTDGWKGPSHIHAVWVSDPLKPRLRGQVGSWLKGHNGLVPNLSYAFWQPAEQEKAMIAKAYDASPNSNQK